MKEKGPSFIPGGDIPDEVRITAWQFMCQQVPQNYGKLVFGNPLCNEQDFDPLMESIFVQQQKALMRERYLRKMMHQ